jgi:hypothetical protein
METRATPATLGEQHIQSVKKEETGLGYSVKQILIGHRELQKGTSNPVDPVPLT